MTPGPPTPAPDAMVTSSGQSSHLLRFKGFVIFQINLSKLRFLSDLLKVTEIEIIRFCDILLPSPHLSQDQQP